MKIIKQIRAILLFLTLILSIFSYAQDFPELDVSGAAGRRATDGRNGADGVGSGGDGSDGTDATHPTNGQDAGQIMMDIGESSPGVLEIKAVLTLPVGRNLVRTHNVTFGNTGYVHALAVGGRARNGGNGGDGGDGATGRRGSNATRHSSGGNGGPGGDGGSNGIGTSASQPGLGGDIYMDIDINDLSLLMLLKPNVSGGLGAKAGTDGRPGSGGRGGRGGSSYSWSETKYRTVTRNGESKRESYTVRHSNPGGSSGRSGSSGRRRTGVLRDSQQAEDGQTIYRVNTEDGVKEYSSRYDVGIVSYDIQSRNQDGILEPTELVYVRNLTIKNTGGMPTPLDAPIEMYLSNHEHVTTTGKRLTLPKVLQPGESYTFPDSLEFRVKDIVFTPTAERISWDQNFSPEAWQARANRPYENDELVKQLNITFPIEIKPITSLRALGPGEATKVTFKITNISDRAFGSMADLKRNIEYYITKEFSELEKGQLQFFTATGEEVNLSSQLLSAIEKLGPKQSVNITAIVGATNDIEPFKATNYLFGLGLDKPVDPEVRLIQQRSLSIRTTHAYKKIKNSKVLFVTNSSIPENVINNFKDQVSSLGEVMSVWDVSYETHLDLMDQNGFEGSLIENFRDGMIILPTNTFETGSQKYNPADQLRKSQFLEALAKNNIRVMFVGPERNENLLTSLLIPTEGEVVDNTQSIPQLLRRFNNGQLAGQTSPHSTQGVFDRFSRVNISGVSFWGEPKSEYVTSRAQRIESYMRREDRRGNWVTVYNFEPKLIKQGLFGSNFLAKWDYGRVTLLRTRDKGQPSGMYSTVSEESLLNSDYSKSPELRFSLLQNLGFDKSIELLERYITDSKFAEENQIELTSLVDSILSYLAWEQGVLRDRALSVQTELVKEDAKYLQRLTQLFSVNEETLDFVKEELVRLMGKSLYMADSDLNIWALTNPFTHNEKVSRASRELIIKAIENTFDVEQTFFERLTRNPFYTTARETVMRQVNRVYDDEKKEFRESIGGWWPSVKRFFTKAKQEFISQVLNTRDTDLNGRDQTPTLLSEEEFTRLREQGISRDIRAGQIDAAVSQTRESLYLANPSRGEISCKSILNTGNREDLDLHNESASKVFR